MVETNAMQENAESGCVCASVRVGEDRCLRVEEG